MRKPDLCLKSRMIQWVGITLSLFFVSNAFSQALTGVKTIPGDYASIALAIDALNANGVGSGGVTFNITGGYTEAITKSLVVTATGTLTDPIVFQKSGGGANPLITSYAGTKLVSSTDSLDVMWAFEGSDFVTINGIDLLDAVSNTTPTMMMEQGFGFYKLSATDGANNNTIQNCTITLNRNNNTSSTGSRATGSVGIEFANVTRQLAGTVITVTATSGANSNNKIYSNTIENCNFGVSFSGYAAPSPYTVLGDVNNDIGGTSALTGNTIINFGGGVSATNACCAVFIHNQWGSNISYNTINNNTGSGVNHPASNRGIWLYASSTGASCDISNNIITITAGLSTSTINWCIDVEMAQTGANGNTINVNNNQFLNCKVAAASTVAFTAIWLNTGATTVNVNDNYVRGFSYAGTGTSQVILSQLACGTLHISNNTIDSTVLTGTTASGTHHNIGITTAPSVAVNITDNNITQTVLNTAGAGNKTLYGIYFTGATPSINILDNIVDGITRNGTTGAITIGIYQNGGTNGTSTARIKRNRVSNISISGTGSGSAIYGIQTQSGTIVCDSNIVFNLACLKATGSDPVYGIYNLSTPNNENYNYNTIYDLTHSGTANTYGLYTSTTAGVRTVSNNTLYNITGGGSVAGIVQGSSTPSVFNNRIYNLTTNSTTTLIVSGVLISSTSSGTAMVYNNLISGLFAPASNGGTSETVRGINITSTSASTTLGIYHNTININATSSGVNFSTTGIFHTVSATATTAALDLRSNIIVNTSTANGTGFTSAFKRSGTGFVNMNAASNNNLFYAGTPSSKNLIFSNGTNFDQTLADYKTRVSPLETSSITENPAFLSTIGSSNLFLMIDSTTIVTDIEAGGKAVNGITKDYLGNARAGSIAYVGTSGAPDIGAYEGNYLGNTLNQMIFDSANADQQTGVFVTGSTDVKMLRIRVYAEKGLNALEATAFDLSTSTTTSISDLLNAKIYYTGSDATFTNPQLFGMGTPNTTYTINGSKRLVPGVNYFWVTYDVAPGATGGNFIDAGVNNIVLSGTPYALINGDPAGNIQIKARLNGNYNIGPGYDYPSLTAAATDLTAVGVSGPVTFTLKSVLYDEVTTGEVFPIVLTNYVGSSTTNTVTIVPDASIAATITSLHATSTIDLNGVSNLIIDGRPAGASGFLPGSNLIIANTSTTGATIRLFNDADSNTIMYTDLRGANAAAAGTATAGVVNIGTTTGNNGNDNNIFRYCDIHASTGGFPAVGISSIGTGATAATNNDRNRIEDCNIYDFYVNTVANSGMYVGANNSAWVIKRNHVYQTAKRNYSHTTALIHHGFWITPNTGDLTTASGFVIDSNYFGGNAADGTGLYEMAGTTTATTGFQFIVMEISVGKGAVTSIQGNTITNFNDSSTSSSSIAFGGINLSGGKINCMGNMIGSKVVNGAIMHTTYATTTGGFMGIRTGPGIVNSAAATTDTVNIAYNIISGIDLYGAMATTTPEFFGLNIFTGAYINVYNNMVGDTLLPNSIHINATSTGSASLQRVTGIYNNPSTATAHALYNNIIANITNDYAGASALHSLTKGILVVPGAAGTFSVTGNLIKNISTASQTTGTGTNATLVGISVNYTAGTYNITGNTIYGLTLAGVSTTAAVQNTGIYYSAPTSGTNLVSRNFIHSQSLTAINPFAIINGIEVAAGNGIITNNMIRMGIDGMGSDMTTACSIRGITKNAGAASVYFNTVYIGGNGVGADNNRTYAFQRTGSGTDNVRNNIFINNRMNASAGSAGHFAVGLNNNSTLTMNYNLLKADTIGLYATTSLLTIANWKAGSLVDANSITAVVNFKNPTGDALAVDLHIDTNFATSIEAYGTSISGAGTILDFDGETRSNLTPHDLGADAGNFTSSDIAPPAITHTALQNTTSTGDRIFSATIVDATGVYLVGTFKPRVYFKKSFAGVWNSSSGELTAGTSSNGTWQFTIGATAMGGLLQDDSVYYFIVAQDSTPFSTLGSFPTGVEGTDVNTISVEPNLLSYKITPIISGLYTVGNGHPFSTLTGTNGLFSYINTSVISGDITIQVASDIEEPGIFGLNQTVESGIGGYKISIVPDAAVVRNITGSVATSGSALIRLEGADRVTINGNYNGAGRYLRIMNRLGGNTINLKDDADNDTIANCIIEGMNTYAATITFYGNATNGSGNDSNAVIGCIIRDSVGAVAPNVPNSAFYSTSGNNDYNTFSDNEVYNFAYNGVNINSPAQNFWTITNNKFYQINAKNQAVVVITINAGSGHTITGNSIGGSAPDRSGAAYTSTSSLTGINIGASVTSTNPITINNNIVSNMAATGTSNFLKCVVVGAGNVIISNNTFGGGAMSYDTLRNAGDGAVLEFNGGAATVSNNVISDYRYYAAGAYRHVGVFVNGGTHSILNNSIYNIEGNVSSTSFTSQYIFAGMQIWGGSNHIVRRNTLYNIKNTHTGTGAYFASGVVAGSATTSTFESNRIYNISALGTGAGSNAPSAIGILTTTAGHAYYHNQISLGNNMNGEVKVSGIKNVSTSGISTYTYNSVFINGQTTIGANNSFGLERTAAGTVNAFNNVFYNKRTTLGTGGNFAVGSSTAITAANLNYNLLVTADTAVLAQLVVTPQGWAALNTLYTSRPNTNWAATVNDIPADSLFTDTLVGDLGIVTNNTHAWYVNGKGIAMTNVSGDFNNASGVRSTLLSTGSTDIGSVEFTPTTLPPVAFADKAPAAADSTQFFFASRLVAKLNWDAIGILPSSVSVHYYSGVNAGNLSGGTTYQNAYWDIQQTGGSNYSTLVTLMLDSAVLGTVSNTANLDIARYTGTASNWVSFPSTAVNNIGGSFTTTVFTDSLGVFTGTDGSNNPLPVNLLALTATVNMADVLVAWSTASETNNAGFDVERSVDGKRFEKIGFVKGSMNSNTMHSYHFKDEKAFARTNNSKLYYRLKQVDLNGGVEYSKMVSVRLDKNQQSIANAYPNPFVSEYMVSFTANQDGQSTIELMDIQGKKAYAQTIEVTKGMNTASVNNLEKLQSGIYFMRVTINGETQIIKLVKQ